MDKFKLWLVAICLGLLNHCKYEKSTMPETHSTIKYFVGGLRDKVESIEKTADGGFIYGGYTISATSNADAFMLKVDGQGNQQWYKTFGGKYYEEFRHAIQTSDGGFLAVGFTKSFGNAVKDSTSANYSDYIVKTDANGNILWTKSLVVNDCEYKYVCENAAHEYLLTGYISISNDIKIFVLKLSNAGNLLWGKYYNPANIPPNLGINYNNSGLFIGNNTNNEILISGEMPTSAAAGSKKVPYLLKLDKDGNPISFIPYFDYTRLGYMYNGSWPEPHGKKFKLKIINLSDGYLLATYTENASFHLSMELIKVDLNSVAVWHRTYSGLGNSVLHAIEANADGSYLLIGMSSSRSINTAYPERFATLKTMLLKVDANGNEIWTKYIGPDENVNISKCVQPSLEGGYTVAGYTCLNESGYDKMYCFKVDGSGNLIQ